MSSPSPLIPQGSFQAKTHGDSNVRLAVTTVIAIHVVFFGGLLLQGCQKDAKAPPAKETNTTSSFTLPPMTNTDLYYTPPETAAPRSNAVAQTLPASTNLYGDLPSTARRTAPVVSNSFNSLAPEFTTLPAGPSRDYEIVKNDTFAKIARSNNVTVSELKKANPSLDPTKLKVGTRIKIPAASAKPAATGLAATGGAGGTTAMAASDGSVHLVKAGETLTRIAKQHGTTVSALRALNGMKTSQVRTGQKLKIPARADSAAGSVPAPAPLPQ